MHPHAENVEGKQIINEAENIQAKPAIGINRH